MREQIQLRASQGCSSVLGAAARAARRANAAPTRQSSGSSTVLRVSHCSWLPIKQQNRSRNFVKKNQSCQPKDFQTHQTVGELPCCASLGAVRTVSDSDRCVTMSNAKRLPPELLPSLISRPAAAPVAALPAAVLSAGESELEAEATAAPGAAEAGALAAAATATPLAAAGSVVPSPEARWAFEEACCWPSRCACRLGDADPVSEEELTSPLVISTLASDGRPKGMSLSCHITDSG